MRLNIVYSKNAEQLYIIKSFRNKNGKSTSKIYKKLGTLDSLLPLHNNSRDEVIAWAKSEAKRYTDLEKEDKDHVLLELSQSTRLKLNTPSLFSGGYLFLQDIFYDLKLDKMCKNISSRHQFKYDLSSILSTLLYSRILYPSSKLSTYDFAQNFIEKPNFNLQDIYRSLDVLYKECDYIQEFVYQSSLNVVHRNTNILYYDCTNFFFEIEEADGDKQFGLSKENRPNPIVQLGLFMDGDGLPLAFGITPGNQNEQTTLKPLEKKIIKDFQLSQFVVCTDAGLASKENRRFNNMGNRSYIVTQSLKKVSNQIKDWALSPKGWHLKDCKDEYDISKIIEAINNDQTTYTDDFGRKVDIDFDVIYYKDEKMQDDMKNERLIVSYSPKYARYQKKIRDGQVERAKKMAAEKKSSTRKNPNSPSRFNDEICTTSNGEIAQEKHIRFNQNKVDEEAKYDGFYAVSTTLTDSVHEIIKINQRRWEIEESFRIMKTEFKARPVYLSKDERIVAHFLTCFLSLLIYRILEKRIDEQFSAEKIIDTLKKMNFQYYKDCGYIPVYTRTEITDVLHDSFGFQTDTQIVSEKNMKKIIKKTKS